MRMSAPFASELNEIWAYMDAEVRNEELSSDDISVIVHRLPSIASYNRVLVLLRGILREIIVT